MILALNEGGNACAAVDMERASRRQPEGPTKFHPPRHQQGPSVRPNPISNTVRVLHDDPPPQREQVLFRRRTKNEIIVAGIQIGQLEALVRHRHNGRCLTPNAIDYLEEFIAPIAIACGQRGFRYAIEEVTSRLFPLVTSSELEETIERGLTDPLRYTPAAIGKRRGVTIEEFEHLGFTHITPAGWGPRKMRNYRGKRRNNRVKDRRHATGVSKTRRELSVARLKPWTLPDAPCKSRSGFYLLPPDVQEQLTARARAAA